MEKEIILDRELKSILDCGEKTHVFESKNDYKDYPCPTCGARDNNGGKKCWRVKLQKLRESLKSAERRQVEQLLPNPPLK